MAHHILTNFISHTESKRMKLVLLTVSASLILYALLGPVRADPSAEAGRRLTSSLPSQPNAGQIKSMDSWLRWILARSKQDKVGCSEM